MRAFNYDIGTKIYFGEGKINKLSEIVHLGKKALVVYGGGSVKKSGLYDKTLNILKENNMEVFEVSGVEPNPRIETVYKGVELCKTEGIEVVIGLGGGSAIDCAKVIAAGAKYEGDAWDLVLDGSKIKAALPIVSILTLSATGTEMDCWAVISKLETNEKYGTGNTHTRPVFSILDPTYTFTVSKKQTAAGSADIMSHILESYFTPVKGAYIHAGFCEVLLKTVIKYAPIAINEPTNYEARANLMWASSLAINDMIKYGQEVRWTVHSIEHELSAFYDITHGEGLAILTPHWMRFALNENTLDKFVDYGVNVWGIEKDLDKEIIAKEAIENTAKFFKELGLPTTLEEVGILDDKYFEEMARKAHRFISSGIYVELSEKDIKDLFIACAN